MALLGKPCLGTFSPSNTYTSSKILNNTFDIIATLSSRLLSEEILPKLCQAGATIARINGAHGSLESISAMVSDARKLVGDSMQIMIDLPGRKVRTKDLAVPIVLETGKDFHLYLHQVNYPEFLSALRTGQQVSANDGLFSFQVMGVSEDRATFRSSGDGLLHDNKGLHAEVDELEIPALLETDLELIRIAKAEGVNLVALSFVNNANDVEMCLSHLAGSATGLVTKVETDSAIKHLDDILEISETILIDRGDLASEIGIDSVPQVQDMVIKAGLARGRRIYLATQFLHFMTEHQTPLIAEANDIYHSVLKGVHGLQLSEETAIGRYPLDVVKMMHAIVDRAIASS